MSRAISPLKPPACPICGRPSRPDTAPFCSTRCKDVDLARWLGGKYAIPSEEDEERPDEPGRPQRDDD